MIDSKDKLIFYINGLCYDGDYILSKDDKSVNLKVDGTILNNIFNNTDYEDFKLKYKIKYKKDFEEKDYTVIIEWR